MSHASVEDAAATAAKSVGPNRTAAVNTVATNVPLRIQRWRCIMDVAAIRGLWQTRRLARLIRDTWQTGLMRSRSEYRESCNDEGRYLGLLVRHHWNRSCCRRWFTRHVSMGQGSLPQG